MTGLHRRHTAGRPEREDDVNRKELILETAVSLYAKQGFEKVTFKAIAEEAGVATSLIRHYFGAKEEFRRSCNKYVLEEVTRVFKAIEARNDSLFDEGSLQGLVVALRERAYLLRYLARLFMDDNQDANEIFRSYYQQIRGHADRLEAAGKLREDISPVWLAFHFIYHQLGTAFLQDQIGHVLGIDPYDEGVTAMRNKTQMNISRYGVFKG